MIKVGTDICSIDRISKTYGRFGQRFLERVLTEQEIAYVLKYPHHTVSRLAVRFAAKEACAKALGTGWRGLDWKEIEILKQQSGAPKLNLHGRAIEIAKKQGLTHFEVSLSHEKEYATAFVVAYGSDNG